MIVAGSVDSARRQRRLTNVLAIITYCSCYAVAVAQEQPEHLRPTFEVAAIKLVPPENRMADRLAARMSQEMMESLGRPSRLPVQHGHLSVKGRSLLSLVAAAYRVRSSQVSGPSWMADLQLDIEAKLPEGTSSRAANEALQCLLEERFGLHLHRESRNAPGFNLVLASNEVRLKPAVPGSDVERPEDLAKRMNGATSSARHESKFEQRRHLPNTTTAVLATVVAQLVHAPVADMTSLSGRYDIDLDVLRGETPDDPIEHRVSDALALLGLRLKAAKVPIEVLVVDHIDKTPSPN
jgi:uncharacterized protein (TIGR03435 family)